MLYTLTVCKNTHLERFIYMTKERITITIPPDLLKDLDEMCAQSGYSRSFLIWRALRLYMKMLDEEE